ncbi:MAG: hypothetical protein ACREJC_03660 [Tepidisphaeraceae bacterium]
MARVIGFLALFAGCADSGSASQSQSVKQRQAEALRDPFSYGPDDEKRDLSGGDINQLDKKALRRDVDSVMNP